VTVQKRFGTTFGVKVRAFGVKIKLTSTELRRCECSTA
jgi:hypothetical protein